eukprot:COSAG01_NODE_4577_length_4906_cov_91.659455_4_plen_72_part_00
MACGGGSRRAWWPCRRGARAWVRSLPPTPARRPSLRGVVLAPVRKVALPPRNDSWDLQKNVIKVPRQGCSS